ncbi:hypothetical protein DICSQDRAFT_175993 [Dichomitus squalens LYAD-421 SS1]|uniref:Uncharacterized protein n=1 Tax=Dichomitus squalens (strain LYAD-421) TaxID=732165 RepID=R7SGV1_DICSQ|nr:uncharacterized protein DICSQDRAFT_175993 [Dichomitus squalens LYAD-421 SS1]EJF55381.1 hypothetical protein DICSQDRAFT_175993 [Dichomitus squalens LYAD-421 SS1]
MPQLASTYRAVPKDVPTPQWFLDHDFHLSFLHLPGNEIAGYGQTSQRQYIGWLLLQPSPELRNVLEWRFRDAPPASHAWAIYGESVVTLTHLRTLDWDVGEITDPSGQRRAYDTVSQLRATTIAMSDHALDIVCAPHHLFLIADLVNHIEQVDRDRERTWLERVIANNDSHAASPIPPTPPLPAPEWGNAADVSGWGNTNVDWSNTNWGDVPMDEADMEWSSPIQPSRRSPPPRDSPSPTLQHLRPMPDCLRSGAPPLTGTRPSPRSPSPTPRSPSPVDENEPPFTMVVDPTSPLEWPTSIVRTVLGTISGGDLTDTTDPDALSAPPAPPTPPLRQPRPRTPPYPTPALGPATVHYRTPLLGYAAYGGALLYDERLPDGWQIGPDEPRHVGGHPWEWRISGHLNGTALLEVQLRSYAWDERWEQIPGVDNAYLIGVLGDNLHPSGRFTETQYLGFLRVMIQARDPTARVTDHDVWREAADNLVDAYDVCNIPVSVRQYRNGRAVRLYDNMSAHDVHRSLWGNFYDDEILDVSDYGESPPPTPATPAAPIEDVLRSRNPSPVSPPAVVHDAPFDANPFRPVRPAPANPSSRSPSPPATSSPIAPSPSRTITFIAGGYFSPDNPGLRIGLWYPPAPSSPLTEPDLELNDRDDRA